MISNLIESDNNYRDLISFFIITYFFSWILWLPAVLYLNNIIDGSYEVYSIMGILASFGPMVAAFSLTLKSKGIEGLKNDIKRGLNIKLGWWWIPLMVLVPIIAVLAHIINVFFLGGAFPASNIPIIMLPVIFIVTLLIGGPLAEEFGWRGYAKPRMEKKMNSLSANLILGLIWGFWHLPLFLMIGWPHHDYFPLWLFILNCVMFSLLIAWFQNNNKQSVVPALIIHTWMNVIMEILPLIEFKIGGNYTPWLISLIVIGILMIFITFFYGTDLKKNKQN